MSFGMFVTWVLMGVLVGVLAGLVMKRGGYGLKKDIMLGIAASIGLCWIFRAIGMFPNAGMVTRAFVAAVGAAGAIVAQRTLIATRLPADDRGAMWRWGFGAVLGAAAIWMMLAAAPGPAAVAAVIAKAGIVTGEGTDLKVTERIEEGSGRVATRAELTARLVLKNTSALIGPSAW